MCIFCEKAQAQLADGITPSQKREVEQCERLRELRVKATILTGFLGSGKTTFLNFVLKSLKHGQRIAVVQNEFGSVSIDDHLMPVERSNTEVVVMPNGCLCCRVRGDLVDALRRLAERTVSGAPAGEEALPQLDGLIIECSGLSEVAPVAQTFFADPYVQASYRLDGVVCVCDAANFEAFDDSEDIGRLLREQLALSDVCLLNKCDLVDSRRRDQLAAKIRTVNPATKVVPCRHGKVNLAQVLKIGSFSLETALSLDVHFLGQDVDNSGHGHGAVGHGDPHSDAGHEHTHHSFGSIGLEVDDDINITAFQEWMRGIVERHGPSLIRIKGVLRTDKGRVILQGVAGHIDMGEPVEAASSSEAASRSRLVFIGRLDFRLSAELRAGFLSTAASAVAAAAASAPASDGMPAAASVAEAEPLALDAAAAPARM
mmetsp:Transcript_167348/g.321451  ORF Transcript_167348/g.321451 Transcript_167348/m.321451 type:complete len:429 (+) Transcript_167348:82-1368(+)